MTVTVNESLLEDTTPSQKTVDRMTSATNVITATSGLGAIVQAPIVGILGSGAFLPHPMLSTLGKSLAFQGGVGGFAAIKGFGGGFQSVPDGIGKSFANLFESSGIGIVQNSLSSSAMGSINTFKDLGIGRLHESLAGAGFGSSLFKGDTFGLAQGLFGDEGKRFGESLVSSSDLGAVTGINAWAVDVGPSLWLGARRRTAARIDRSVNAWLLGIRPDLSLRHRSIRHALENSLEPVLHASTSAVELISHLFNIAVSDEDVRDWAAGHVQFAAEAIDNRQQRGRVTWAGRVRLAAIRAGLDEAGQTLAVSLSASARQLQQMKHDAHRYEIQEVEVQVLKVEELLSLFAWRI